MFQPTKFFLPLFQTLSGVLSELVANDECRATEFMI